MEAEAWREPVSGRNRTNGVQTIIFYIIFCIAKQKVDISSPNGDFSCVSSVLMMFLIDNTHSGRMENAAHRDV
ncbi:hypothetical protein ABTF80_20710, partial [Acinetobacter baumannii]